VTFKILSYEVIKNVRIKLLKQIQQGIKLKPNFMRIENDQMQMNNQMQNNWVYTNPVIVWNSFNDDDDDDSDGNWSD